MCGAGCKLYWLHYGPNDMLGNFYGAKKVNDVKLK
jgi:hypothetical protein